MAKDNAKGRKSGKAEIKTNAKAKSEGDGRLTQGMGEADKVVGKLKKKDYEAELERLQLELVKLQEYIKEEGLRVVVVFEGRDAAGKGGTIKRINEAMNPRVCRIAALPAPSSRERTQWYFQRYVAELPAAGEMVLFDRSWYNRAGVERVMGFCDEEEYQEFLRATPLFEEMLLRSNIKLIKYWFSVSDEEQERRFQDRLSDPSKHWKLSPMDLESRRRWVDYSRAKDVMFARTDTRLSPWWVVEADNKRRARLNTIAHLLSSIPYVYEPKPRPSCPSARTTPTTCGRRARPSATCRRSISGPTPGVGHRFVARTEHRRPTCPYSPGRSSSSSWAPTPSGGATSASAGAEG